jgi:hypothetical protein
MQLSTINIPESFKNSLRELYLTYYQLLSMKNMDEFILMAFTATLDILDKQSKYKHILGYINFENKDVVTEYKPEYPEAYMNYAATYINSDGFFGLYKIPGSCKTSWMKYPEWKYAVDLVPDITADLLNKSVQALSNNLSDVGDLKALTTLINKALDLNFRISKDSGHLKDDYKKKSASKNDNKDVSSEDINLDIL